MNPAPQPKEDIAEILADISRLQTDISAQAQESGEVLAAQVRGVLTLLKLAAEQNRVQEIISQLAPLILELTSDYLSKHPRPYQSIH